MLPCGNLQPRVELQRRDESDSEADWESNWESDWGTAAASGVQCSCSLPLDLRTCRTGLVEKTRKLRRNQADWTKTEDKKKEKRKG